MRGADFTTGTARLRDGLKVLMGRWDETQEVWNDAVSREFEEKYLSPLETQSLSTIDRAARLAQLFLEAQHACADRRDGMS